MKKHSINKHNLLKVLDFLDSEQVSRNEILKSLNIKSSTFYKHLNSIKNMGFKVKREEENYELVKFKKAIKFAKYELGVLGYLLLLSNIMLSDKSAKKTQDVLMKMIYMSDEEDYLAIQKIFEEYKLKLFEDCYSEKILKLEEFLKSNKNIKIITKNNETYNLQNPSIDWKKENFYITFKDKRKTKTISLDNVIKISQENEKEAFEIIPKDETIFELYGKLTKSYLLREDERIIDVSKDKLVVASSNSDKASLFKRLLRYDVLCKIVFPKSDVFEFCEMIKKSLANLEEIQDNI